jgi:hypothetical protein
VSKNSELKDCAPLATFLDLADFITMICMKESLVPTLQAVEDSNQKDAVIVWLTNINVACQQLSRKHTKTLNSMKG